MSEIITIVNQKGGVGKTTTAVNLATALAFFDKKVLLVDFDSKANATKSFGFFRDDYKWTIYHLLVGTKEFDEVILTTLIDNLELIPANMELISLDNLDLKKVFLNLKDRYDFIIIDTPPNLGNFTIEALNVSDSVIIPLQAEFFSLEGLEPLLKTIQLIKRSKNPKLSVKGILPTMLNGRTNFAKQILSDIVRHFKKQLFYETKDAQTTYLVIPRDIKLAEAPSFGKPIFLYDIKSRGAVAYQKLALIISKSDN